MDLETISPREMKVARMLGLNLNSVKLGSIQLHFDGWSARWVTWSDWGTSWPDGAEMLRAEAGRPTVVSLHVGRGLTLDQWREMHRVFTESDGG